MGREEGRVLLPLKSLRMLLNRPFIPSSRALSMSSDSLPVDDGAGLALTAAGGEVGEGGGVGASFFELRLRRVVEKLLERGL
jgi:hypothetical protein